MNCTVCGNTHTKEQPLTIAHNNEWLCSGCLKELDAYSRSTSAQDEFLKSFHLISPMPLYGSSPIEVRRPTGFVRSDRILSTDEIGKAVITTNGTVKVGNMELPIERLELK